MGNEIGKQFGRLVEIMAKLRGPDGCPWDKEQTYKDINPYMLEEVHEVMESIDNNDMDGLKEELGDLLLHIVFHAQMATEDNHFNINDVIDGICKKLVYRHPHVFANRKVKDSDDVIKKWERLKIDEGKKKSILGGVPPELPALLKAFRLGEKAGRVGFDWQEVDGIIDKLQEEVVELGEARANRDEAEIEHEYGDLLFTIANIGRFLKVNPEDALRKSTNRFSRRFKIMEKLADARKSDITDLKAEEWNNLWEEAKKAK
jgi:tetrapyrrole methylase family protein/MazG family protein